MSGGGRSIPSRVSAYSPPAISAMGTEGIGFRNYGWRKFDKWCWSCGWNLKHNSWEPGVQCKNMRNGHDSHLSATPEDPQGSPNTREHLKHKWCGPDCKVYIN